MFQHLRQQYQRIPAEQRAQLRATLRRTRALWWRSVQRATGQRRVVVIASSHRVGSTGLFTLTQELGHFATAAPLAAEHLEPGTGMLLLERPATRAALAKLRGCVLLKSHSYPPGAPSAPHVKYVSIYRDPRDVIISNVYSLAYLRPWHVTLGGDFRALDRSAQIQAFITEAAYCLAKLEQWYRDPHSLSVRYEDLLTQPAAVARTMAAYLEIRVTARTLQRAVHASSFSAMSGRAAGQEQRNAQLRKGTAGEWRSHFDPACVAAFKTAYGGRWNALLLEMGYEQQPTWDI